MTYADETNITATPGDRQKKKKPTYKNVLTEVAARCKLNRPKKKKRGRDTRN